MGPTILPITTECLVQSHSCFSTLQSRKPRLTLPAEGYIVKEHTHPTSPAAYPPIASLQYAPYTDCTPLRYAPSMDVPVTYPAQGSSQYPPVLAHENVPPRPATEANDKPKKKSKKRKHDEGHNTGSGERLRPEASSRSSRSLAALPSRVQDSSGQPQGTQRNPLEIESSPEPEARGPSRQQTSTRQSVLPQDLRHAGLYVQGPNSTAKKVKYYAVPGGKVPGIYTDYNVVLEQIRGYSGADQKGFRTEDEAWAYMNGHRSFVEIAVQRQKERANAASYPPQPIRSASMAQRTPSSPPQPYTYTPPTPPSERSIVPAKEPVPLANDITQHHTIPPANQHPTPNFVPEPEPTLSAEQQHVVDLIVAGENVFYTGSAGCGKSTILKAFVKKLKEQGKQVRIVAPTNLAALNVNGQTTWNFAGWTPDSMKKPLDKLMAAAHGKEVWERFDNTDVLVLDEISMVENLQFERLNEIMKASRGEKFGGGAFGGVQVVVTGDVSHPQTFAILRGTTGYIIRPEIERHWKFEGLLASSKAS
jgi:ATP-dependent DNA helicase PIF1